MRSLALPGIDRRARIKALYRDDILDAALAVLSDVGYHQATMQQIASVAGLSVGSLYNYFASKDVLYGELVSRFAHDYLTVLDGALDEATGPVEKIRSYIGAKGEFFRRNQQMAKLYFGETRGQDFSLSVGMDAQSQQRFDAFRLRMAAVFEDGMNAGVFEQGDPFYRAVALQSITNAFLFLWLRDPEQHPYHERVETIATLVLHGAMVTHADTGRRDDGPTGGSSDHTGVG